MRLRLSFRRVHAGAARRLHGGREGVLYGGGSDLGRWGQARARPAGRGGGACHFGLIQGQGREGLLSRQQAQHQLPPQIGPPPPRLRSHPPRLRPTHATLPTPRAYRATASAAAPQPSLHEQPLAPQPTHGAGGWFPGRLRGDRFGGSARDGGGRALPPYSLRLVDVRR
jgi:hypothetical protein